MSEIEITANSAKRRHWSAAEKLRVVEEIMREQETVSSVARSNGVAPNRLYRWRQLMLKAGKVAVISDDRVSPNRAVLRAFDALTTRVRSSVNTTCLTVR